MSGSYNTTSKLVVWAVPLSLATTYGIDSLSFPPVTEMFHFTGYCFTTLCIQVAMTEYYLRRVIPFGHLRVKACLPLTVAYRSLPRPSSPLGTKAFMIRP
jgi:hypothetical protein